MREIKFRGQNMINGEWIFGFYIHDKDNHCIVVPEFLGEGCSDCGSPFAKWIPIYGKSKGQYTGLKDKNGKEIYEGDIVEFVDCQYESETLCVGEVIFEEFGWHFTNSITESSLSCYDSSEVKIIGNIYENKELLEEE